MMNKKLLEINNYYKNNEQLFSNPSLFTKIAAKLCSLHNLIMINK